MAIAVQFPMNVTAQVDPDPSPFMGVQTGKPGLQNPSKGAATEFDSVNLPPLDGGVPFGEPLPDFAGHSPLMLPPEVMFQADQTATPLATSPTYQPWGPARDLLPDSTLVQQLPEGLLYKSYLAGEKEPRISSAWLTEKDRGLIWEATVGGRVGLWRYGTPGSINPQGFQIDVEGAAMVRLDPEVETDVEAVDFRFGLLATWRDGPWSMKTGYYHISSHLGDEFLLKNPGFARRNYVRDSTIVGVSYDASDRFRVYAESAYAVGHEGGAEAVEFQYGAEYSSNSTAGSGGPYAAINGHTREDEGWVTSVNIVSGWQWRGAESNRRFRVGMQYYQGPALQYSFVGQTESLLGGGLWFDY